MAADSDGSLTAVVICEGNLHDPEFPRRFRHLLAKLKHILQQPKRSKKLKVNKVEPWNSVRVTLSIPKDAAARLRQLASEGSNALRALGILSVQLEGDTVISLRLVGHDIVLRTDNSTTGCVQEAGSSNTNLSDLSQILGSRLQQTTAGPSSCPSTQTIASSASPSIEILAGPSHRNIISQSAVVSTGVAGSGSGSGNTSGATGTLPNPILINGPSTSFEKPPLFKSPNTVCPMDGKLPVPPLTNIVETREYPFESMTQARVIQRRENTMAVVAALGAGTQPTVAVPNAPLSLNQGQQITPPPLAIPVAANAVDSVSQQPVQAVVKSPFMQPPPPPYPIASGTNTLKPSSHTVQHTMQQQTANPMSLSNGANALSSPLLVNLLQNDGVSQMKVPSVTPSVLLHQQQQQAPSSSQMVPNLAGHTQNDGVLLLNNSNNNNDSGSISISPSIPVPSSSQTISNISSNVATTPPVPAAVGASGTTVATGGILNQNMLGPSHQSATVTGVGIRVQQQRFSIPAVVQQQQTGAQQPNLVSQHQILHGASSVQMPRYPLQQNQAHGGINVMGGVPQSTFRHPLQQTQPQVGMQPYATLSPTSHPSPVNHAQQQPGQQVLPNNFNHPRWPFKPMDSATKSSFQEFARYQLQYNLQQEMNNQTTSVAGIGGAVGSVESNNLQDMSSVTSSSNNSGDKSSNVPDALGLSSYLDELSKTDLDSLLLPGLGDLDSALDLDGKNALESLLDAKDLDLDLIDQDGPATVLQDSMEPCPVNSTDTRLQPPAPVTTSSTPSSAVVHQIQPPPPASFERARAKAISNNISGMNKERSEKNRSGKERQYLINPLTGELEPVPSEDESEFEEPSNDNMDVFNEMNSEISNSLYSDDENSCSTAFSKASDHSDTERSSNSEASGRSRYSKPRKERRDGSSGSSSHSSKKSKPSIKTTLLREKLQQGIKDKISGKSKQPKEKILTKAKLIPIDGKDSPSEKIKLRLKLEKSEPVSPAYKVDISFVPSPKRAHSAMNANPISQTNYSASAQSSASLAGNSSATANPNQQTSLSTPASHNSTNQSPHSDEPRVPPLHISLRGKNSIIIKNSKKDRKKSQSGGEEDETYLKKMQIKRNNNSFDEQNVSRYIVSNDHLQFSNNANAKGSGQGKPTTRISSTDYSGSNSYSKSVLENGEESEKNLSTSKRIAMESTTNPNGLISHETKRRRMSQSQEQQQQLNNATAAEKHFKESYNHTQGPIGSTNVGTLPAHTSLSKNQKASNNNNNSGSNFINKLHKNSIKSGKPIVVVKHCKSPTTNPVKDPGKSPPIMGIVEHPAIVSQVNCQPPTSLKPLISSSSSSSSSSTTLKATINTSISGSGSSKPQSELVGGGKQKVSSKYSGNACPLPQGSTEAMSKEKFKQKLLEFQGSNDKEHTEKTTVTNYVVNTSCTNNSNSAKAHEQIVQISETNASPVSVILMERKSEKSTPQVADATKTLNTSIDTSLAANSSTNSANCKTQPSSHIEDVKEQCSVQEHQLRPPNASQSSVALEVNQNLLNNGEGNGNVRNSPGSQAQGEDSGIESMDALSEKSPHQSASPQQGDTQPPHIQTKTVDITHKKIEEKVSIVADEKDDQEDEITNIRDIEAALAKMEGINEHFLTPCESPMHKLNGEHSMKEENLLENLTDDKIMLCATKLEQEEDLAAIMGGNSSGKSTPVLSPLTDVKEECRDLNENKEISLNVSLETQLVDECCKKSLKPNIKHEDDSEISTQISSPDSSKEKKFEENVIEPASSLIEVELKVAENNKVESAVLKEETVVAGIASSMSTTKSSPRSGDVISETNDKSLVELKEILAPITIEIPSHTESEVPRVRTRASSKLESPLDAPKQSPQLDSPATITNVKSNLKLTATVVDRLSPKVSIGKSSGCTSSVVSIGSKRKRQGSESSTQSCVSDDATGRNTGTNSSLSKRSRPNSLHSSAQSGHEQHTACQPKPGSNMGPGQRKQSSSKVKKAQDESSDSDEPLIEVAEKFRSCKGPVGRPSSSEEKNENKVLRNHRAHSQQSRSSGHSSSSATSAANHHSAGHSLTTSKTSKGSNGLHSNSVASGSGPSTSVAASNSSNNSSANTNTHCTRASSGVGVGSSSGPPASTASVVVNNSTSSGTSTTPSSNSSSGATPQNATHDDKIGTRRSVRASAAANKMIYSRSGGPPNHNSNTNETSKLSTGSSHKNSSNTPSSDGGEPRRKTRSAAGGEVTDGRRRRGSRDSK